MMSAQLTTPAQNNSVCNVLFVVTTMADRFFGFCQPMFFKYKGIVDWSLIQIQIKIEFTKNIVLKELLLMKLFINSIYI